MREHASSSAVLDPARPDEPGTTAPQQVVPLTYTQLRLLAECTAGLDEAVDFVFTETGSLQVTTAAQDTEVLVPARQEGKYPANQVRLQVGTTRGGGLVLEPGFANAVFWSDAAVQKFVFPYVSSCGGDEASRALSRLQAAWNHYPAGEVSVYALVHVTRHPRGIPLGLGTRFHVVYAKQGKQTLAMAPLDEFLNAHHPVPDAVRQHGVASQAGTADLRVTYQRGDSHRRQHPGYPMLRALAEHACALCNEPRYFLFKPGEEGYRPFTTPHLPPVEPGDIVIPAYTPTVPAHRPTLDGVWCHPQGQTGPNLAPGSDAVFWSDGAIEQFLYPYYASKGGIQLGLKELLEMAYVWMGQLPPELGPDRARIEADVGVAAQPEVNFIHHIKDSEWIWDTARTALRGEGARPGSGEVVSHLSPLRDLGVGHVQGGPVQVDPVAKFIERYWPRRG